MNFISFFPLLWTPESQGAADHVNVPTSLSPSRRRRRGGCGDGGGGGGGICSTAGRAASEIAAVAAQQLRAPSLSAVEVAVAIAVAVALTVPVAIAVALCRRLHPVNPTRSSVNPLKQPIEIAGSHLNI